MGSVTQQPSRPIHPTGSTGSVLLGALYTLGFYLILSLALALGAGLGGVFTYAWLSVALAWAYVAGRLLWRPRTRSTGYGMLGAVVVGGAVFWSLGQLLSLVVTG